MDMPPPPCDTGRGIMRKERNMAKVVEKLEEVAFCMVTPNNQ